MVACHNLDGFMAGFKHMHFLCIFMLPFPGLSDTGEHFCGTYVIVVIFTCRVSSLSVCVHMYWVLLNLVPFAMLIFLMNTHSSHFSGACFMAVISVGRLCGAECFGSLLLMCELYMNMIVPDVDVLVNKGLYVYLGLWSAVVGYNIPAVTKLFSCCFGLWLVFFFFENIVHAPSHQ